MTAYSQSRKNARLDRSTAIDLIILLDCRVTGRGYMDVNRISGYIPGKIVFFLMQVGPISSMADLNQLFGKAIFYSGRIIRMITVVLLLALHQSNPIFW